MRTRNDFFKMITKNVTFLVMLKFKEIWIKKSFSKSSYKNIIFLEMKPLFSKRTLNNNLFLEMLIFLDIWARNYFFKEIKKPLET